MKSFVCDGNNITTKNINKPAIPDIMTSPIAPKNIFISIIICTILLSACSHIRTSIIKTYDNNLNCNHIALYGIRDTLPDNAEKLGFVRIFGAKSALGDNLEKNILEAKYEAKKIGGNALRITMPSPTDYVTSERKLRAEIYRIPLDTNFTEPSVQQSSDTTTHAILHFYRTNTTYGNIWVYPVLLNDSLVYNSINSSSKDVIINHYGTVTIIAVTESRASLTITIEPGKEYYIKCGIRPGNFVAKPSLWLMRDDIGKFEFDLIE